MAREDFALIILAGNLDESVLRAVAPNAAFVLCADSGAEHAKKGGIELDAIIGDLDSISSETLRYFKEQSERIGKPCEIMHIAEQEHNDFEKSLMYLSKRWNGFVRILGMTGGRTDHTLSNLSVMLRYSDTFSNIEAFDGEFIHSFLTTKQNHRSIECPVGTIISLMPYGEAIGVTTQNLQYPLLHETLRLGEREGLSNNSTNSPVTITMERGALLVSVQDNVHH